MSVLLNFALVLGPNIALEAFSFLQEDRDRKKFREVRNTKVGTLEIAFSVISSRETGSHVS